MGPAPEASHRQAEQMSSKEISTRSGKAGRIVRVIGASLLLSLLFLELGTRIIPVPGLTQEDLNPSQAEADSQLRTIGHPYLAYVARPDWSREADDKDGQKSHDANGFRNPAPPKEKAAGVFRIACLGGSSTYGSTPTSDAATWPAQLETILNQKEGPKVEVLNGGLMGWSTFESLINYSLRVADYQPDLVIVYHAINDMRCALYLRGGDPQADNTHWRLGWPRLVRTPGESLLELSQSYLIWRKYMSDYGIGQKSLGFYGIKNYRADDMDPFWRETPPPQGFQNVQRNLISLQAVVKAHGAQIMFGTQGCKRTDIRAKSKHQQWAGLDEIEAITRQVAEKRGAHLCESRLALESQAEERGTEVIFTREVHLTDEGARVLASAFAERIWELNLIRN